MRKRPLLPAAFRVLAAALLLGPGAAASWARGDGDVTLGFPEPDDPLKALKDFRYSPPPRQTPVVTVKADPARPWVRPGRRGSVTIDLSDQWPGDVPRDQGLFGTCTAFAAVALYEAATARGKHCIRLSEADAFLQADVLRWRCWDGGRSCADKVEGFNVDQMSEHIRTKGVLTGDDYVTFMSRYADAREQSASRRPSASSRGWFATFLANPFDYTPLFSRPVDEVRARLESYAVDNGRGHPDRQRRGVAAGFSGYVRQRRWSTVKPADWNGENGFCREDAKAMEEFIDGELLAGRPVAVEMFLKGLSDWSADLATSPSGHAFVIKGLHAGGGQKFYLTRNSWGGIDPVVWADQLCRVAYAESLLIPGESPAPAGGLSSLWSRP